MFKGGVCNETMFADEFTFGICATRKNIAYRGRLDNRF